MPRARSWSHKWKIISNLSEGAQGRTHLVNLATSSDNQSYVLKVLKNLDDPERRRRFATEAAVLARLDHPGASKWVDDNATAAQASDDLYIVTSFIEGGTLAPLVGEHRLDNALGITTDLLNTVEYCHRKGILHRDIKPDNIIIDASSYPVLIDFGIAFDEYGGDDRHDTSLEQDLGNRFIIIPELRGPAGDSADKRDTRSDVTAVVGILFYLLTGVRPGLLLDADNALPHQRELAKQRLRELRGDAFPRLAALFDRGFKNSPEQRFQTVDDFRAALMNVSAPPETRKSSTNLVQALDRLSSTSDFEIRRKRIKILQEIASGLHNAHHQVAAQIADQFESIQSSRNLDPTALTFRDNIGFRSIFQAQIMPMAKIEVAFVGNELVATATFNKQSTPLWRCPVDDFQNSHSFQDAIRAFLHKILTAGVDDFVDQLSP